MKISFLKMEGAGNDFLMIDAIKHSQPISKEVAKKLCDRHFGIGADQIMVLKPSNQADFRMEIINADGGEVEMCGNGIRCFAKFVYDAKLTSKTDLAVETLAGIIRTQLILNHPKKTAKTDWVKVDMGPAILEGSEIPTQAKGLIKKHELIASGKKYEVTCVSMGNPHCVIFVDDVGNFPVSVEGPPLENHSFFPKRTNVEFIQVINRKELKMRVWERGTGETLACGTGACGATVAAILNGLVDESVIVHLQGGDLEIQWDQPQNRVYMTGPATEVFSGEIEVTL